MPVLSNPRHERFAQLLAQGKSAVDAHEQAGYKRNMFNAANWARKPEIKARVTEINNRAAERAEVTRASLIAEAEEARQLAMRIDQPSAAINAVKEKGVLAGIRIERTEAGEPGEFEAIASGDLREFVQQEALALALIHAPPSTAH